VSPRYPLMSERVRAFASLLVRNRLGHRGVGRRVWDLVVTSGSYLRRIDFVYHSTLGFRVIKKEKKGYLRRHGSQPHVREVERVRPLSRQESVAVLHHLLVV